MHKSINVLTTFTVNVLTNGMTEVPKCRTRKHMCSKTKYDASAVL